MEDCENETLLYPVDALAGLYDFHNKSNLKIKSSSPMTQDDLISELDGKELGRFFPEDWLSQFWYDRDTTSFLVSKIQELNINQKSSIACISCPSVFRCLFETGANVDLFEFDSRFQVYGKSFKQYDFNHPEDVPLSCLSSYSIIILDPPFLSTECLFNMSQTVKLIAERDAKIILCTGISLETAAKEYLGLFKTAFTPKHNANNDVILKSKFGCYSNFEIDNFV